MSTIKNHMKFNKTISLPPQMDIDKHGFILKFITLGDLIIEVLVKIL